MSMAGPQGQAVQIVNKYLMPDGTLDGVASFRTYQGSSVKFVIDLTQFQHDKDGAVAVVQSFINSGFTYDGREGSK